MYKHQLEEVNENPEEILDCELELDGQSDPDKLVTATSQSPVDSNAATSDNNWRNRHNLKPRKTVRIKL